MIVPVGAGQAAMQSPQPVHVRGFTIGVLSRVTIAPGMGQCSAHAAHSVAAARHIWARMTACIGKVRDARAAGDGTSATEGCGVPRMPCINWRLLIALL